MSLSDIADWASIVALLISGFNTLLIFSVKRRIVLNVTLEPMLARLTENSARMNGYLLGVISADVVNETIGLCEAEVRAIRRRFGGYRARFCRRLRRSMSHYRRRPDVDTARDVYNDLQQVIQEIANRAEEMRITGP
jgi:hypothetical protein